MSLYQHIPSPRTKQHLAGKTQPVVVANAAGTGFNSWLAVKITSGVGTMACAYLFTLIALLSLPTILKQAGFPIGFDLGDGTVLLVSWVAQTFIQLVLLSIIIVGQNIQAKATDKRAQDTFEDAKAVLAEALKIQEHLEAQDAILETLTGSKR